MPQDITLDSNAFTRLYANQKTLSKRRFKARGISLKRCERCQLGQKVCICIYTPLADSVCDFVLLMHSDEVFKPTNTGKLIARIFPKQTYAFCWNRCEPDPQLLNILSDSNRTCLIVFPQPQESTTSALQKRFMTELPACSAPNTNQDIKKITFIMLDGTWRQSSRMLRLSRWLDNIPCFSITDTQKAIGQYAVRKAPLNNQLATAQAAALCLRRVGDVKNAQLLDNYFDIFNQHYVCTRMNTIPLLTQAHSELLTYKQSYDA